MSKKSDKNQTPPTPKLAPAPECSLSGNTITIRPRVDEEVYRISIYEVLPDGNKNPVGLSEDYPVVITEGELKIGNGNLINKMQWAEGHPNPTASYILQVYSIKKKETSEPWEVLGLNITDGKLVKQVPQAPSVEDKPAPTPPAPTPNPDPALLPAPTPSPDGQPPKADDSIDLMTQSKDLLIKQKTRLKNVSDDLSRLDGLRVKNGRRLEILRDMDEGLNDIERIVANVKTKFPESQGPECWDGFMAIITAARAQVKEKREKVIGPTPVVLPPVPTPIPAPTPSSPALIDAPPPPAPQNDQVTAGLLERLVVLERERQQATGNASRLLELEAKVSRIGTEMDDLKHAFGFIGRNQDQFGAVQTAQAKVLSAIQDQLKKLDEKLSVSPPSSPDKQEPPAGRKLKSAPATPEQTTKTKLVGMKGIGIAFLALLAFLAFLTFVVWFYADRHVPFAVPAPVAPATIAPTATVVKAELSDDAKKLFIAATEKANVVVMENGEMKRQLSLARYALERAESNVTQRAAQIQTPPRVNVVVTNVVALQPVAQPQVVYVQTPVQIVVQPIVTNPNWNSTIGNRYHYPDYRH